MKTRGKRHFLIFNIHTHPGDFFLSHLAISHSLYLKKRYGDQLGGSKSMTLPPVLERKSITGTETSTIKACYLKYSLQ